MTTAEEISSIINSELTSEEKSTLLASYSTEDHISPQEINKVSTSSRVQHQAKAKGSIDSLTTEEISSILNSGLTLSEKSTLLASYWNDEDTLLEEGKVQLTYKEQAKQNNHNFSRYEASERIQNESVSPRAPQQENIIPPSEDSTSSTSSRIDLEENNPDTEVNAKGKHASSSFRTQVRPVNDGLLEMKGQEIFIVRVKVSGTYVDGEEDEKIHQKEAVCKHCFKYVCNDTYVFKAKCRCKLALIHKDCMIIWSAEKGQKCSACEQEIENIPVVLSRPPSSSPPQGSGANRGKQSTSTRFWSCLCIL